MKKLEMIELEPYQAPALADIVPVSVVYGEGEGHSVQPDPGGDTPAPGPSDPTWDDED